MDEKIQEVIDLAVKAFDERQAEKERIAAEKAAKEAELQALVDAAKEEGKKLAEAEFKSWNVNFMQKAPTGSEGDSDEGPMKAFAYYLQTGDKGALKALQEGTDCEGGYAVPQGFVQRVEAKLPEFSWPRAAGVEVLQHRGDVLRIPSEGTEPALPSVAAEEAGYATDSPTLETTDVTLYKFTKLIKISEELDMDAPFFIDFIVRRVAEAFGEAEGKYVAVGTGSSQPSGVMTGGTAALTFDSTGNITADEIPELFYKLQSAYRGRPSTAWAMHPDTEAYLRMIRDANAFAFPGGSVEGGSIALGGWKLESMYNRPVFNDDDFGTIATGAKVIVIGDWSYYKLVEHPSGYSFKRLEELYSANGQIGLRWFKRWGGAVSQAEAFQYGTMA